MANNEERKDEETVHQAWASQDQESLVFQNCSSPFSQFSNPEKRDVTQWSNVTVHLMKTNEISVLLLSDNTRLENKCENYFGTDESDGVRRPQLLQKLHALIWFKHL